MTTGMLSAMLLMIVCWNGLLQYQLARESLKRRELAVAFRQAQIDRRARR